MPVRQRKEIQALLLAKGARMKPKTQCNFIGLRGLLAIIVGLVGPNGWLAISGSVLLSGTLIAYSILEKSVV
jgi:hypothetical protein